MKIKLILGASLLLLVSVQVNAAIISVDWRMAGDNLITQDTVSGLEWLDLTESANRGLSDVITQFGSGGDYEGFKLASQSGVVEFWQNAGIPLTINNFGTFCVGTECRDSIDNLLQKIGILDYSETTSNPPLLATMGFTSTQSVNPGVVLAAYLYIDSVRGVADFPGIEESATHPSVGSYLVRNTISAVPVPAAVWLFGTALIGLVGFSKRKAI